MMILSAKTLTVTPKVLHCAESPVVWIRTVAGAQIGFGHLRRTIILAEALQDCCTPLFLLDPVDYSSKEHLAAQGYEFFDQGLDRIWSVLPDPIAILIDTRLTEGLDGLFKGAQKRGIPVISIHDLGLNLLPSDIIIDGSIVPVDRDSGRQNTAYCCGTDYMILDPAYNLLRPRRMQVRDKIRSILINLGGGDSHRYFPLVLEGIQLWGHEVEVVGVPGFVRWGQESLAQRDWHPLHFHWESLSVAQLLCRADLAVTAGGIAAYEALCAGTPLFALSYDSLQQTAIAAIEAVGACIALGPGDNLDPVQLARALAVIDSGCEARRLLSLRGQRIVDGLGTERVSQVIRQLIYKRSQPRRVRGLSNDSGSCV